MTGPARRFACRGISSRSVDRDELDGAPGDAHGPVHLHRAKLLGFDNVMKQVLGGGKLRCLKSTVSPEKRTLVSQHMKPCERSTQKVLPLNEKNMSGQKKPRGPVGRRISFFFSIH